MAKPVTKTIEIRRGGKLAMRISYESGKPDHRVELFDVDGLLPNDDAMLTYLIGFADALGSDRVVVNAETAEVDMPDEN